MGKDKSKSSAKGQGLGGMLSRAGKPWVQVLAQMHDHSMTVAGASPKNFFYDAKTLVETTADVAAYYQMDTFAGFAEGYNFEVEALGGKMIYGEHSMPTIDFRDPLIKKPEDLDKLKTKEIDYHNAGRLRYALDACNLNQEYGMIQGFFCSPFSLAVGLRSFPRLARDMKKNPEFAHELFTFIVDDVLVPWLKAQNKYCDIILAVGADAWACIPNLSVKEMEYWVVPYLQRLMEKTKKFGVMPISVSGDYCEERIEKFDAEILHGSFDVEVASQGGVPSIFLGMGRWQDYPLESVRDYTAKFREQGKGVTITAGLNARMVRDGPVEKIVDNVKRFIDAFGRDHDLSVFFANIPADTPPDHVHAAVAAIHTYGKYPIEDNLDDIEFKLPKRESFHEWKKKIVKSES